MPALSLSGQGRQRQIVLLAVGGVLLGGLLLIQVPRTLKMLNSSSGVAQPSTETTAPSPPATPAATPPAVVPNAPPVRAKALARFRTKDPFVQQVDPNAQAAADTQPAATPTPPPAPAKSEAPAEPASFRALGQQKTSGGAASATISVNGDEESVKVSNGFPKSNPVFKLVSLGKDTAKVGVARGTLKGGSQTVTLSKGEPLTLLNTVDGKRYRLELVLVS